jgi:DNA helicase-2/ATP-dependent DNA helicase PcrA
LLPHSRSLLNAQALEEERRLCYVGMTRARDVLILTRASTRRRYGNQMPETSRASRFLNEIPLHLIEDYSVPLPSTTERTYEYEPSEYPADEFGHRQTRGTSSRNVRRYFGIEEQRFAEDASSEAGALRPGSRVRHAKYGYGTVLRREGRGGDTKLTVSFPGFGVKKLVERYADLERV